VKQQGRTLRHEKKMLELCKKLITFRFEYFVLNKANEQDMQKEVYHQGFPGGGLVMVA
jgi:hypothetical protein